MLSAKALTFAYNAAATFSYPDLHSGVDMPLLITGRSGSGKTTLLHLLAGILPLQEGELWVDGISVRSLTGRQLDAFRGRHIGIVYQRSHFMAALPVIDNILLPQYFCGTGIQQRKASALAQRLHIDHLLHKLPAQLSQGEQQRASIARALVNDPKVLLADEPTASLDDDNCRQVVQLLREQSALSKAALVIVTHDERVKAHFSHRIHLT